MLLLILNIKEIDWNMEEIIDLQRRHSNKKFR